jgi:hypothetical protein
MRNFRGSNPRMAQDRRSSARFASG